MNPDKFNNKYRIPSARLQTWDYGNNGSYFITICTKNRFHYFGEIDNNEMLLNDSGKIAEHYWEQIPIHFNFIELGNFTVMPNHIHGILIINKLEMVSTAQTSHLPISKNIEQKTAGQKRVRNQGKNTISSIVGSYKSIVSKKIHINQTEFEWQARFHDHIINDAKSFENIQNYIANNPLNWKNDKFYK